MAFPARMVEPLERRMLLALTGQYFDSLDFQDLKLTRSDATVDFTWAGAPDASMGANFFSVRWRGQVQPQYSQEYTFYVNSDDGARLWVDGRLLIDNWVNQSPTEKSGKIALEANEKYDIRLDYYEFDQGAQAHLSWSSASQSKQVIPSSRLFTSPSGLTGTYFDNQNFTGPTTTRTDANVDFTWGNGSPATGIGADTFSTRWTGYLQPQYSQTYTFYVTGDADSTTRLRIDGQTVIDSTSTQDGGVFKFEANKFYDVELEYTENLNGANVRLEWSSPSQARQVVPSGRLFTAEKSSIPTRVATYTNSVQDRDLPDPGVIYADGFYWMTHTMGGPDNGWPLYKSSDMVSWTFQKHLLTSANKPAWMTDSFWAPEIHKINGQYLMTGTSWSATYGHLVIAIASSPNIDGPYTVQPLPIVNDITNTLDSDIFQDDDGRVYLLWKRDSNAGTGTNGSIRIRELNSTGSAFAVGSVETQILDNAFGGWELNLAEAPWLMHRNGFYYLFYSGAHIDTTYSEGVARATSLLGPYTRNPTNPILTNNSTWGGPGHGGFALDRDGIVWFLYHARHQDNPDYGRVQMLDRVLWGADNWPTFGNGETPSVTQQTGPRVNAASGANAFNLAGDATLGDVYTVRRSSSDSSILEVLDDGTIVASARFTEIASITIDGRGGNDTLLIDNSLANAIPGSGITFHGSGGTNTIRIIGSPDADDVVQHNSTTKISLGTGTITYDGVAKLRLESGRFAFNANITGAALELTNATLTLNTTQTLGQVDLLAGGIATLASGSSRVLKVSGLTIAPTARLDLGDNDLIYDYTGSSTIGTFSAGHYTGVQGLIATGRADGAWNGLGGIGTSMPQASDGVTTLAAGEAADILGISAAQTGTWEGVAVDGTSVIVKYTWAGDANFDGTIDGGDYGIIDNFVQVPNAAGYFNGDFNYDGVLDGGDYGIIDNNVQLQGVVF